MAEFCKYLATAAGRGKVLDSERTMALHFHTSRSTLRKVIAQVEADGLLKRNKDNLLTVNIPPESLLGCGKILFVSVGKNGRFFYPAMERLYCSLEKAVRSRFGNISCFLSGNRVLAAELAAEIAHADVILLGIVDTKDVELLPGVFAAAAPGKIFIRVSGNAGIIPPERNNFILPDNYLIGKTAAKLLVNSGCRRPLTFWRRNIGTDFAARAQGFSDMLFQSKCGGVSSVFWLEQNKYASEGVKLIRWALRNNYDGFFVMSDEKIAAFAGELYDRDGKRWKVPLVTVDGCQDSLRFDPPICAIGHATRQCTDVIMSALEEIANGKFRRIKKLISPDFHNASSLLSSDRFC